MDPGASFEQAWEAKDISALIGLLGPDGTAIGDGGGLVDAELRPVDGGERIAHYLVGLVTRDPGLALRSAPSTVSPVCWSSSIASPSR